MAKKPKSPQMWSRGPLLKWWGHHHPKGKASDDAVSKTDSSTTHSNTSSYEALATIITSSDCIQDGVESVIASSVMSLDECSAQDDFRACLMDPELIELSGEPFLEDTASNFKELHIKEPDTTTTLLKTSEKHESPGTIMPGTFQACGLGGLFGIQEETDETNDHLSTGVASSACSSEEEEIHRGFWARMFGRRRDDNDDYSVDSQSYHSQDDSKLRHEIVFETLPDFPNHSIIEGLDLAIARKEPYGSSLLNQRMMSETSEVSIEIQTTSQYSEQSLLDEELSRQESTLQKSEPPIPSDLTRQADEHEEGAIVKVAKVVSDLEDDDEISQASYSTQRVQGCVVTPRCFAGRALVVGMTLQELHKPVEIEDDDDCSSTDDSESSDSELEESIMIPPFEWRLRPCMAPP